jgi:hypothetical protein
MKRCVSFFVVPLLALAACSGGDDGSGSVAAEGWCSLAQRVEDSSDRYELSFDSDDETIAAAFEEFATLLDDAKDVAPDEIDDAVETAARGIAEFGDLLGEVDYDLFALDQSALAKLESMSEEMDTATAKIEAYNLRECGIAADADGSDSDDSASSAEAPAAPDDLADDATTDDDTGDIDLAADETTADEVSYTGDPNSDWCVASRELDRESAAFDEVLFADPDILEAALIEMVAMYEAAALLAPPELVDDVAVSLSTIRQFQAALMAAEYDFVNADLSALDGDDANQIANDHIETYNEQVCGIVTDDDGAPEDGVDAGENDFDAAFGTVREQAIAELVDNGFTEQEASCVFDGFDFTDPDVGDDTNAILGVFESCDIDLTRLAELGG